MNPYVIIVALVVWGATAGGAFWFGTSYEQGRQAERQALLDQAVEEVTVANQAFTDDLGLRIAQGFAGIRVVNRNITTEVRHEHEVQTRVLDNPDCDLPASTVRLLNRARGYGEGGPGAGGAAGGLRTDDAPGAPGPGR
jgi:hypothetical protein